MQACDSLGPIDILINCAGYAVCGLFEETSVDDFKVSYNIVLILLAVLGEACRVVELNFI